MRINSSIKRWPAWLALLFCFTVLLVVGIRRDGGPTTPEERIEAISQRLACPVCDGESVYESRGSASQAIRQEIARQVADGQRSDDEIVKAIDDNYEADLRLAPSASGIEALAWALPIAVTVVAVVGLGVVFARWRRASALTATDADRVIVDDVKSRASGEANADAGVHSGISPLEEERDFLLRSLDDLERERAVGDVDDDDYAALKDSYVARAAAVIRDIESISTPKPSRRIGWRPVAWGLLVTAVAIGAGVVVARSTGERSPGMTMTGPVDDGSVSSLLVRARSMGMSDMAGTLDLYSRVLAIEPDNVEALTYFGWYTVLSATQQADADQGSQMLQSGMVLLRQATVADDTYPDAHCFLGIAFFRFLDDAEAAKPEIDACLAANPPAQVKTMVEGLASQIDSATTTTP